MFEKVGESLNVVTGSTDGKMTITAARWACGLTALATAVLCSKYTRKRAAEGKPQILNCLF